MKLVVGLGNPEEKYKKTRHNIGFLVLDELKNQIQNSNVKSQNYNLEFKNEKKFNSLVCCCTQPTSDNSQLILAKPQTHMNDSGKSVSALVNFYKIETDNLYVIHDDLDIALGKYKIEKGHGPKDHKGIISIEKSLGKNNFWRIRVGVENRPKALKFLGLTIRKRVPGEVYVLQNFSDDETELLSEVMEKAIQELMNYLDIVN